MLARGGDEHCAKNDVSVSSQCHSVFLQVLNTYSFAEKGSVVALSLTSSSSLHPVVIVTAL